MTRWLSATEQQQWRAWLSLSLLLPEALDRDLREHFDITLAEYEILVHLSEAPERRLRMSDLAASSLMSRSRLTHLVTQMEADGLVTRQKCDDDGRGKWAVLTEKGWTFIVQAAPVHVTSVRRNLVDVLDESDFAEFGRLCRIIVDKLEQAGACEPNP